MAASPESIIGLRFTTDGDPGIRRVRRGRAFTYLLPNGKRVSDGAILDRIRSLAVPPAYRDVWLCTDSRGHLQATGRDARGRKQYRYHPRWREQRDAAKFDRMLEFGDALRRIRRRVAHDLRKPGLPRERVLAAVVRLLEFTLVRIGNEEYVRANGSYGLTTLRDRHVNIHGATITFEFKGKSGIAQQVTVDDPELAQIVRRCADVPGQELFQWVDAAGGRHRIDSNDVNEYLRQASGGPFTAKDYRTWFATLEVLHTLRKCAAAARRAGRDPAKMSQRALKRMVGAAIATAAARLGNTPAICRKCYVHPQVLAAFADGRLGKLQAGTPAVALRRLLS